MSGKHWMWMPSSPTRIKIIEPLGDGKYRTVAETFTVKDAHLLAAASELLRALRDLVGQSPAAPGTLLREIADDARAVIARAEGRYEGQ